MKQTISTFNTIQTGTPCCKTNIKLLYP